MNREKIAINPKRLNWCCKEAGISLEDLAKKKKISLSTLKKANNGEEALSIPQSEKIAKFFNRGLLFLLNKSDINENKVYSPQFRTLNNQKAIKYSSKVKVFIEKVEKQREIYLSLLEDLGEDIIQDWYPSNLDLNTKDLVKTSKVIRDWLSLPAKNNFNSLRQAVEDKGIIVILSNGYNGQWQLPKEDPIVGFSLYYNQYPVIVVKKQSESKERQAFTLMHELAHLLLHKESMIDDSEDINLYQGKEREANEVAGNVLVPPNFLKEINIEQLKELDVSDYHSHLKTLSKKCCVSVEVLLIRLVREGLLNQKYYNKYKRKKQNFTEKHGKGGTRKYRHKEPINIFGKKFVNTVFDALSANHITLYKASTYLDNLQISKVRKLEIDVR